MKRTILHCDLNNFFASVECLSHPELKDRPVAVCGSEEERHGIVLAKNYPAKAAGITTGETVWQAKSKCRELTVLAPHYEKYVYYSNIVRSIYEDYTDMIEPFGIDEGWLDVSGSTRLFGQGYEIADAIRQRVKNETGLTISAGVSFNKIFAKLGSDMKKPDAVSCIGDDFREKIWHLPASDMLGVGRKTAAALAKMCIFTIGDIANTPEIYLTRRFGKIGLYMHRRANGLDSSEVIPSRFSPVQKSVGKGITLSEDITGEEAGGVIRILSESVGRRLRALGLAAGGISLCVKNSELKAAEYSAALKYKTQSTREIARAASLLYLEKHIYTLPIRALTVTATALEDSSLPCQLDFFFDYERAEKEERLDCVSDEIQKRFGRGALVTAGYLAETRYPRRASQNTGFGQKTLN